MTSSDRETHSHLDREEAASETDRFTIRALDEPTWDAFAAPVEADGGIFGGCWCTGFHPATSTHQDADQPHREQQRDRVRRARRTPRSCSTVRTASAGAGSGPRP